MSKSKRHPIRESAVKAVLRDRMFHQRVVRDRTKYNRNDAKCETFHDEDDSELALNRYEAEYGDCEGSFEDVLMNLFKTVLQKTLVVNAL